jgi:hypothetical protein
MVEEAPDGQDLRRVHFEAMPHATIKEVPDDEAPTLRQQEAKLASHMPVAFIAVARAPPPDATIIADPYEMYLREHGTGAGTNSELSIAVTTESRALRAILPLVDGQDKVEAILDPGC